MHLSACLCKNKMWLLLFFSMKRKLRSYYSLTWDCQIEKYFKLQTFIKCLLYIQNSVIKKKKWWRCCLGSSNGENHKVIIPRGICPIESMRRLEGHRGWGSDVALQIEEVFRRKEVICELGSGREIARKYHSLWGAPCHFCSEEVDALTLANMPCHENVTNSPQLGTQRLRPFVLCLMKNGNGQFAILMIPIICQFVVTSSNRVLETIIKLSLRPFPCKTDLPSFRK